jgi:chromosome segregation protein
VLLRNRLFDIPAKPAPAKPHLDPQLKFGMEPRRDWLIEPLAYSIGEDSKDSSLAHFIMDEEREIPAKLREAEHALKRERTLRAKADKFAAEARDKLLSAEAKQVQQALRASAAEEELAACRARCEREAKDRGEESARCERLAAALAAAEQRLAAATAGLADARAASDRLRAQADALQAGQGATEEARAAAARELARAEREAEAHRAERQALAAEVEQARRQARHPTCWLHTASLAIS